MRRKDWLAFDVLGVPVPAPRPSVGRRGVYMDRKSEHWKGLIRDAAQDAMARDGWETATGPIRVKLEFVMVRRTDTSAQGPHAYRPDLDNLVKLAMDALTRAKVYRDDGLVWDLVARKEWQKHGERFAGLRVSIAKDAGNGAGFGEEE